MSQSTYDTAVAARDTQIPIANAAVSALANAKANYNREPTSEAYAAVVAANATAKTELKTLATLNDNIQKILTDDVVSE